MASGKGKSAPLPGQAMELDAVSEEEQGDDVQEVPVTGKRKSEAGASPTKREAGHGDAFSWNSLKNMLADQTKELQAWYKEEIGSEGKIMKAVDEIKSNLTKKMDAGQQKMDKMEAAYESVLERLGKLEARGVPSGPSGGGGTVDRGPSLVFGGWRTDTKKAHILADLMAVLKDSQVDGLIDNAAWVPAVRHSVAIAEFVQRKGENADGMRTRMMAIIAAVNSARVQSEHTADGKAIWAAISRPRSERGPGQHCGKTRKLFYQLGLGVSEVECGYSTGSTWYKDNLVSSVEKMRNGEHVSRGILDHSWIDVPLIAKLSGKNEKEIGDAWEKIVQS